VNLFFADKSNHAIRVVCGFVSSRCGAGFIGQVHTISGNGAGGFAGDGGAPSSGASQLNTPLDVKINQYGNLFFSDNQNHRVRAICYDTTQKDLCGGVVGATPVMTTIAGSGSAGDSGDFASAKLANITLPAQLLLGKSYAEDSTTSLRDNNIVFLEQLNAGTTSGNIVRIICGDNSAMPSSGFCNGQTAGIIYRVAGIVGSATPSGDNGSAQYAGLGQVAGLTYDNLKNILVSSGATDDAIRQISFIATSNGCGLKFSVTDNNQQTSYYCLRYQIQTQCTVQGGTTTCDCAVIRNANSNQDYFVGQRATDSCP
jgi:hypothetical protein